MLPRKFFLTKGIGRHRDELSSFALALENASIGKFNLVKVSSIIPPKCEFLSKEKGTQLLKPGQIVYCVLAENKTNQKDKFIAVGMGIALPKNLKDIGYVMEYASSKYSESEIGTYAENSARDMLSEQLGINVLKSMHITHSAKEQDSLWTTTVVATVFII